MASPIYIHRDDCSHSPAWTVTALAPPPDPLPAGSYVCAYNNQYVAIGNGTGPETFFLTTDPVAKAIVTYNADKTLSIKTLSKGANYVTLVDAQGKTSCDPETGFLYTQPDPTKGYQFILGTDGSFFVLNGPCNGKIVVPCTNTNNLCLKDDDESGGWSFTAPPSPAAPGKALAYNKRYTIQSKQFGTYVGNDGTGSVGLTPTPDVVMSSWTYRDNNELDADCMPGQNYGRLAMVPSLRQAVFDGPGKGAKVTITQTQIVTTDGAKTLIVYAPPGSKKPIVTWVATSDAPFTQQWEITEAQMPGLPPSMDNDTYKIMDAKGENILAADGLLRPQDTHTYPPVWEYNKSTHTLKLRVSGGDDDTCLINPDPNCWFKGTLAVGSCTTDPTKAQRFHLGTDGGLYDISFPFCYAPFGTSTSMTMDSIPLVRTACEEMVPFQITKSTVTPPKKKGTIAWGWFLALVILVIIVLWILVKKKKK